VTIAWGEGRSTVVDGFTIQNGTGTYVPSIDAMCGGGIFS
jgi:hypothetical protein